jgi:hypothetical protein
VSSYRTQQRDGIEWVIADDDRRVGQLIDYTNEKPLWMGRSHTKQLSQDITFDSCEEAFAAVKRYAEQNPGHTFF